MFENKLNNYTNHTGGAAGSDYYWSAIGKKYGVKSVAYTFNGHNIQKDFPAELCILTSEDLQEADKYVIDANKILNRIFPMNDEYSNNLIRRDWFQVKKTDHVYAISKLDKQKKNVIDGSAWAIQMAINKFVDVDVFDITTKEWYYFNYYIRKFENSNKVPFLTTNFTGIGTCGESIRTEDKKIKYIYDDCGIEAINSVYLNTIALIYHN